MDSIAKTLYNRAGEKIAVQLLYDEYLRLSDLNNELPLLRIRFKQITELLQSGLGEEYFPLPASAKTEQHAPKEQVAEQPKPVEQTPVQNAPPAPIPASSIPKDLPAVPEIKLSESSPIQSTGKEYVMPIPPMLLDFLTEQDPSQKAKRLIMTCAQKLSSLQGKRITLSLHKPYICLWDFDEWKTFAFGEIIQGHLYLSVESSLQPDADAENIWIPPSGLYKKPLVRRKVDAITDELLEQLTTALTYLSNPAAPRTLDGMQK